MTDPVSDTTEDELVRAFLIQDREHAVIMTNPSGVIVAWLAGAQRLLGYRADEIVGRHIAAIFTPEDRSKQQAEEELNVALAEGRSEDERWHMRRDGGAVWVTGVMSVLRGTNGDVIGFVKVMRDRTDLRAQTETLENRVAGLTERHETHSQFMATLGHELRTPLAAIGMATQLIEKSPAAATLTVPIGVLKRQAATIQRLADDLMELCRLDLGRVELRLSRFTLQELLRDCTDSFSETAARAQIELVSILPEAAIEVTADRERLQQVVQNLIDNALKYTPRGGRVSVRAVSEPPDAVVRVEDTGMGIGPDVLPKVFELFTRSGAAAAAAGDGLGIGLAVAKQIIELHGGSIEARSPGVDKGAVFAIRVPSHPSAPNGT